MTRNCLTYLIGLCLALVLVAPVMAQRGSGGDGGELTQAVLDRTDQLIDQADGVIRASGSEAALKMLDQARTLQEWAKSQIGIAENKVVMAATIKARELIKLALKLIAPGGNGDNELTDAAVQRKLDKASDKLDRAHDVADFADNANLDALYQAARANLDRAWEFYRNKQYRPALKLAEQAELAAGKILMLATESGGGKEEGFDRWVDNVSNLIDQVGQMLQDCDSEAGKDLLQQASQNLDLAKDLRGNGKSGAFQALRTARELAMKAARECRGTSQLGQRLDRLTARLETDKDQGTSLSGSQRTAFDKLVDQAGAQLDLARGLIGQNHPIRAQAALQAALLAIRQAESLVQQGK
jgi:hypothetical protein